jgi:dienelactone hydrolase
LAERLGLPPHRSGALTAVARDDLHGLTREDLVLVRGGAPVPASFLAPVGAGPFPAILYCHAHGNAWEIGRRELLEGRPALRCGPYGPALTAAGFAVLCLDMPGHGARRAEGSEGALAKAALWRGGTLMGEMLADLRAGVDALSAHPRIDAARIGALGLSMGGTHAYWLAALEPRVAAVAHLCVLADMAPLIAQGAHDLHGAYMTVPGLLTDGDMGDVAALVAPRPHFVGLGADDPLTPEVARRPALARLRDAYARADAAERLHIHVEPDVGHWETPEMRGAVLAFLAKALNAPSAPQSPGGAPRGA